MYMIHFAPSKLLFLISVYILQLTEYLLKYRFDVIFDPLYIILKIIKNILENIEKYKKSKNSTQIIAI